MQAAIAEAKELVRKYGETVAVDGVSFAVEEGEVFGLLGPNGAGKSTTIAMLSCLISPTAGEVRVAGMDARTQARTIRRIIGVVPQELALYPTLSARDNLRFFGEMYGLGGKELRARIDEVLDVVAMRERAGERIETYSGGMKRRINLAVGLINRPRILFLDEPTVGVDPQSRNHIFESVERLNREQGMAILYTTHYMEEAERLCRRVGIVDRGKLIALDTPRALIGMLGGGIIQIGLPAPDEELLAAARRLPEVAAAAYVPPAGDGAPPEQPARAVLKVETRRQEAALVELINLLTQCNVTMLSLETLEPNLESVFLHLTGKSLRN